MTGGGGGGRPGGAVYGSLRVAPLCHSSMQHPSRTVQVVQVVQVVQGGHLSISPCLQLLLQLLHHPPWHALDIYHGMHWTAEVWWVSSLRCSTGHDQLLATISMHYTDTSNRTRGIGRLCRMLVLHFGGQTCRLAHVRDDDFG